MDVEGNRVRIDRLVMHTHPLVTGPSDSDLDMLRALDQEESWLYEIGGELDGTLIKMNAK
jgi:hypothetical protein